MKVTRRRLAGVLGAAGAAVVALAATAYACTNLATLNLSSGTGKPGDPITLTGSSFATVCVCGPNQAPTPVKIRWGGLSGDVIAEVTPSNTGSLVAAFAVPETKPGYYVIVATQRDLRFDIDAYGTPAHATFEVLGSHGESTVSSSELESTSTVDEGVSSGLVAFTIGVGVLGLALFAGGSFTAIRQLRSRKGPATAKSRVE